MFTSSVITQSRVSFSYKTGPVPQASEKSLVNGTVAGELAAPPLRGLGTKAAHPRQTNNALP